MTTTPPPSTSTPTATTSPRTGGPPRWLVVVLLLVVGVGIATQRSETPGRAQEAPTPVVVKLTHEVVLTGMPVNPLPSFSGNSSFFYDAATNRVVVLYSAFMNSTSRDWYLRISVDGGSSFAAPVSLASIAPWHNTDAIALAPGIDQTLHVVTMGTNATSKRCIEVLSTTDDGLHWKVLDRYQSESLGQGANLFQAGRWGEDLLVCYVENYQQGRPKLVGRRIAMATGASESFDLMQLAADATLFIQPLVSSTDFVLVSVMEDGGDATIVHSVALTHDGALSHPEPLVVPYEASMTWPKMALDASGQPYQAAVNHQAALSLREMASGLGSVLLNRDGKRADFTRPGVLRGWDTTTGWADVDDSIDSPRWGSLWDSNAAGLTLATNARYTFPEQGWNIDRIDLSAGGWTNRWLLELPQRWSYNQPQLIARSDGAALIFAKRSDHHLVLLITDPLPGLDATKTTNGSRGEQP